MARVHSSIKLIIVNINRGLSGIRKMLYSAIKHLQACGIEPRIAAANKGREGGTIKIEFTAGFAYSTVLSGSHIKLSDQLQLLLYSGSTLRKFPQS